MRLTAGLIMLGVSLVDLLYVVWVLLDVLLPAFTH